jgi:hypothetical protein
MKPSLTGAVGRIPLLVVMCCSFLSPSGCESGPGSETGAAGSGGGGTGGAGPGGAGTAGTGTGAAGTGNAGTSGAGTGGSGGAGTGGSGVAGAGGSGVAGTGGAGTAGRGGSAGTGTGGTGRGGSAGTGAGGTGRGGSAGTGTGGTGRGGAGGSGAGGTGTGGATSRFSFFVTSLGAMRDLSGSQDGFGGNLTFGETGDGAGLRGADKICRTIAERSLAGAGQKEWRAFLSAVSAGPGGAAVHARDRVGAGPWYDRMGRQVASNLSQLLMNRPADADPAIRDDLPNENGLPNHSDGAPGCTGNACPDNHDTLTGSTASGMLMGTSLGNTCNDWTSAVGSTGRPGVGHSWPSSVSGTSWIQAHTAGGCGAGVNLVQGGSMSAATVGSAGGYGGIFCFALTP